MKQKILKMQNRTGMLRSDAVPVKNVMLEENGTLRSFIFLPESDLLNRHSMDVSRKGFNPLDESRGHGRIWDH